MINPSGTVIGEDFYIQNANSNVVRYLSKFEIWWTGSVTLETAIFDGNTVWGGAGVANTSPTYVTLSSSPQLGTWAYKDFQFIFNGAITSSTITFVKYTFTDGCYVTYGSHS
jgi:hypothetical protein